MLSRYSVAGIDSNEVVCLDTSKVENATIYPGARDTKERDSYANGLETNQEHSRNA